MKRNLPRLALLGMAGWLLLASAWAQPRRPHIGFTYPAGGQQATTVQIRLGGQDLDDVTAAAFTGTGITARVVEYFRRLNNQELQLLNEQLRELKKVKPAAGGALAAKPSPEMMVMMNAMNAMDAKAAKEAGRAPEAGPVDARAALIARIEQRTREWVQQPACASIANLVFLEVTIAPDAEPGPREIRLVTARGVSNPLPFHVGQLPEYSRKPMTTATIQVLGKEAGALRKRPANEAEVRVALPCTVNGQIASGEVNRYRFEAVKGQRLVISTQARQLIPYIADAVPGWFQPVAALYDAQGREVAFADDYRFRPDPVILFQVPHDGEYVFAIYDSIYRGREDFVYRVTLGELPFVTSVFPLGAKADVALPPDIEGWNIADADLGGMPKDGRVGTQSILASRMGYASNRVPFDLELQAGELEREPNNALATAQKVTLPVLIDGRINAPGDTDVYQFEGKKDQMVVAEVMARRLDSPLDSVVKLTDAAGKVLAFNDDREDLTAGANTHHADSYLMTKLPADGTYFVHIGDTARKGGSEYGYRLRLSPPQPDFELRVVPSSFSVALCPPLPAPPVASPPAGNAGKAAPAKGGKAPVAKAPPPPPPTPPAALTYPTIYVVRKDGFAGPIELALDHPPAGFTARPVVLGPKDTNIRMTIRSGPAATPEPVRLSIVGSAKVGPQTLVREAVPAEDRMQAFLWRHLAPASELRALIYDPNVQPIPKRPAPVRPPLPVVASTTPAPTAVAAEAKGATAAAGTPPPKPKFTKQQIAGRLRELKRLYEEGLLTDEFYDVKVSECETAQ